MQWLALGGAIIVLAVMTGRGAAFEVHTDIATMIGGNVAHWISDGTTIAPGSKGGIGLSGLFIDNTNKVQAHSMVEIFQIAYSDLENENVRFVPFVQTGGSRTVRSSVGQGIVFWARKLT